VRPENKEANGDATLLAQTPVPRRALSPLPARQAQRERARCWLTAGADGQLGSRPSESRRGRIVYQDLTRINKAVAEGKLRENEVLIEAFARAKRGRLHFLGLVSNGGVHSHQEHLVALAAAAADAGVTEILVHAITDGRDASPTGGATYLEEVERGLQGTGARIATVIGRYFAMDRDKRWERTKLAWDAIVSGEASNRRTGRAPVLRERYAAGETDEFLQPLIFSHPNEQRIADGDVILFFNFRADRARQISQAFLRPDFDCFDREATPQVHYVTLTQYDKTYGCPAVFGPQSLTRSSEKSRRSRVEATPSRRDGEIPARHLLLQWWDRAVFPRRGPRDHPSRRKWRHMTCSRR
jgi:2,3-bisphosphoglycerate-independent phosphoglycerate mutase